MLFCRMVVLCLKLYVLCDQEWVDSGVGQYDAATLDGLCQQIGETLLRGGWITQIDGVKVDSFFGVVTDAWHPVSTLEFLGHPDATGEAPHRAGQWRSWADWREAEAWYRCG